jgi:hypothetical protein
MKLLMENWKKYLNEAEDAPTSGGAVDIFDFGDQLDKAPWEQIEPLLRAFMEKKVAAGLPKLEVSVDWDEDAPVDPVLNKFTEPEGETEQNIWQLKKWGSEFVQEGLETRQLECEDCKATFPEELAKAKEFFNIINPEEARYRRVNPELTGALNAETNRVFALWKEVAGTPAAEPEAPAAAAPEAPAAAVPEKKKSWFAKAKGAFGLEESRKLTKSALKQLIKEELSKEEDELQTPSARIERLVGDLDEAVSLVEDPEALAALEPIVEELKTLMADMMDDEGYDDGEPDDDEEEDEGYDDERDGEHMYTPDID